MEENKDGVRKEEYQVIQEQIVPKKKKNWKRFGKTMLRVVVCAVVFGVVAGAVLVLAGKYFIKKFGVEDSLRQVIGIGTTVQNPPVAEKPTPTQSPKLTEEPEVTGTQKTPEFVITPPEATPGITVTIDGDKTDDTSEEGTANGNLQGFLDMYAEITKLAGQLKQSMVQITAITEGVDWFEEAYETTKEATGLYVGDNGVDMLFLVNLDRVEGATKFEATFRNGETVPCTIFSYDTNYRLAVLAIRLSAVSAIEEEYLPVKAKFALGEVQSGTPVMVLGNPNGQTGAMELGMITGVSHVVQVIDDEVLYFTTGITEYAEGDGFVFDLAGQVIGIVSSTLNKGEKGIITAAMVSGMQEIIENTLNNVPRMYCGMRLETVDSAMGGKYKLPAGIYVTEVLPGSPAMTAGIKNGDIITTVGITEITGVRQFYEEINRVGIQNVRVLVSREIKGERKVQTLYLLPETRLH